MRMMGLDIGGANLKAATNDGWTASQSLPLWKAPERLLLTLTELIAPAGDVDALALTMTGELADCYATKADGVAHITDVVTTLAGSRAVHIWSTGSRFVDSHEAKQSPFSVAAANWHALATWCGRLAPRGPALLIDIGTTTTDIIPLVDGHPSPRGLTDLARMQSGELLYTGIRRTPLCAVCDAIPFRGGLVRPAAELFATTLDVYLLTGDLPEDENDCDTADGRPATRAAAANRLAHMLCADRTEITAEEVQELATMWAQRQRDQIAAAVQRMGSPAATTFILSGSGEFLARGVLLSLGWLGTASSPPPAYSHPMIISLRDVLDEQQSTAGCAFAVAQLLAECS